MFNSIAIAPADVDNTTFLRRTRGNYDVIRLATSQRYWRIGAKRTASTSSGAIFHIVQKSTCGRINTSTRDNSCVPARSQYRRQLEGYYGVLWRSLQPHEEPAQLLSFKIAAEAHTALEEYRRRVKETIYGRTFTEIGKSSSTTCCANLF
ncbi:hypothetical protein CF326_g5926 [Tilletia indica]|nr:hypothetical protein CF326_g5926 [Tilletia indica]